MAADNAETWTVRKVLGWTSQHFEKANVDAPRLTAELLLGHSLKVDRVTLYTQLDRPLNKDELGAYRALIQRRVGGEPTQYLTGQKEFYGRRFQVDARVLIPRPETELLVEAVLKLCAKDAPSRVLDLCTGSGCIAVTIACERPQASVWATDLLADACAVAKLNAEALGAGGRVTVLQGDLLAAVPQGPRFDVVVSNPPYVMAAELPTLQREVQREPRAALDGGADGLDLVRRIAEAAPPYLKAGGTLALEIGDGQGDAVRDILVRAGYHEVRIEKDLARHDRLAFGRAA
ncbi:MAG: peptide chain release factor N(5)-glutamine methyltransferase [Archangiaceae bacterium]|nr:peptide chain release factor N(5)-glutamine methyltransferase [Archangiaceae bacterium]